MRPLAQLRDGRLRVIPLSLDNEGAEPPEDGVQVTLLPDFGLQHRLQQIGPGEEGDFAWYRPGSISTLDTAELGPSQYAVPPRQTR